MIQISLINTAPFIRSRVYGYYGANSVSLAYRFRSSILLSLQGWRKSQLLKLSLDGQSHLCASATHD